MSKKISKIIILPGNGGGDIFDGNFYGWTYNELKKRTNIPIVMKNMPDPYGAKESIWLPFIKNELGCDENTILIGHSSGAEATMRLLENQKVIGAVLVSPCVTDLGDTNERASGYYNRPWEWDKIRSNAEFIMQFGSPDDHLVPIAEGREVAKHLQSQFHELPNRGHFLDDEFPELVDELVKELQKSGYLN